MQRLISVIIKAEMSQTSRKYLDDKLRNEAWSLLRLEIGAASFENIKTIMGKFLPPGELMELEKRLAVIVLLGRGFSYKQIQESVDISPHTIINLKSHFEKKARRGIRRRGRRFRKEWVPTKKMPTYIGKGRWEFLHT